MHNAFSFSKNREKNHIALIDIDILQQHNNITIESLIHYQFLTEKFKDIIKNAWFKTDYAVEKDNAIFEISRSAKRCCQVMNI